MSAGASLRVDANLRLLSLLHFFDLDADDGKPGATTTSAPAIPFAKSLNNIASLPRKRKTDLGALLLISSPRIPARPITCKKCSNSDVAPVQFRVGEIELVERGQSLIE